MTNPENPHPTSNPNAFYGKLATPKASDSGLRMQLKNHRRKCRTLSRALGEARSDVSLLKDALIKIVNQSDVNGHWDHEHGLADKALMTLEENIRQRNEERVERLKRNGNIITEDEV